MNVEELEAMRARIRRFEEAHNSLRRYEKIQAAINEFPGGKGGVTAIVVDLLLGEFRYSQDMTRGCAIGSSICSLSKDDQAEFFREFLDWAKKRIAIKIACCQLIMDEV